MKRGWPERLGSLFASATSIATGYMWAKHGLWVGAAVWGGVLLVVLALYGALEMFGRAGAR